MTESTFATATAWSFGLALAGYLLFAVRVAPAARRTVRARLLLLALVMTAAWCAASALIGLFAPTRSNVLGASVADALRYGAWFLFIWHLSSRSDQIAQRSAIFPWRIFAAVGAVLAMAVLLGEGFEPIPAIYGHRAGFMLHLGLAVFGLMLTEQIARRVHPQMRWSIRPLAVALAGIFGLDLLMYADAMLFGNLDPDIWVSRGIANLIVLPFLAIATARNTGWTVDLHLSRGAVFHSTALLLSGLFLLAVAGAGYFVRYFGGEWSRALQIELLFAATVVVALVATSGRFRSKLKVFVSKHFFSYRYDYREEWLRFTRTMSTDSEVQGVPERTIMALANLVESPAGILWLKQEPRGFVPTARWNTPPVDVIERSDSPLVTFLERTAWIVSLPEFIKDPSQYVGLSLPAWFDAIPYPWLVVPLTSGTDLIGFVVLATPRTVVDVDWEVRDLLKTASRQAASYLGQIRATEALVEARKFDAFNRMSAFVVHDLKNLMAQLSLMLTNSKRHHDKPEFQADMQTTVEHVVGRMNALMLQLRTEADPVENPRNVDIGSLVRRVCAAKSDSRVRFELELPAMLMALGHEDRLDHVIGHLLQNAIDATLSGGSVIVRAEREDRFAVISVIDEGQGMTPEFIRERLFKPFQTTKPLGMGIGVYESAQYVTGLGGEILIDSEPGAGTRVRVRLPQLGVVANSAPSLKVHAA